MNQTEQLNLILEKISSLEEKINLIENKSDKNSEIKLKSFIGKKVFDKSLTPEVESSIDKTVIHDILQDFLKEENEDIKKSQPIFLSHSDGTTTILVKDYNDLRSISEKLGSIYIREVKII